MNQAFSVPSVGQVLLPGYVIDLAREELRTTKGGHVDLRPRSFAVLRLLATNVGRLVTKDQIMDQVWDDVAVTEDSLTQCIADIRRAIGDEDRRIIRTVPRRGYLLIPSGADLQARVTAMPAPDVTMPAVSATVQAETASPIRHATRPRVAGALVVVLALLGAGLSPYWLDEGSVPTRASQTIPGGPSIAVMPFEGTVGDQAAFADELAEDIIASLSRFKELRVLARNMTARYRGKQESPIGIGRLLGADYIIEGVARRKDEATQVSIALVDAGSGAQIWAQSYAQPTFVADEQVFRTQTAARASASLGGWSGAIAANETRKASAKSAADMTPYQCIILASGRVPSNDQARRARECLRVTLENEPRNAAAWAGLAVVMLAQRYSGFGLDPPESVDMDRRAYLAASSVEAAQKATELAPADPFTRFALARAHYGVCNRDLLRTETERTLALNPNDAAVMGTLGNYLGNAGFWETGRSMAEKAIALTEPTTPYWWRWVVAKDAWLRGEYSQALDEIQRARSEPFWLFNLQFAYMLPSLGKIDEARAQVATVLRLRPDFTISLADAYYRMWCFEPSYREKMRAGLRAAGLPE